MWSAQSGESAKCRAHNEAHAECGAHHSHQFGALFRWSNICHRTLGYGNTRTRCAIKCTSEEQHPQRPGQTRHNASHRSTDERKDDDWLASDAVRNTPKNRRENHLRNGERGEHETHLESIGTKCFCIMTEDGHDDAKANEVESDSCPNDPIARRHWCAFALSHDECACLP